jgi:hypothetical protein
MRIDVEREAFCNQHVLMINKYYFFLSCWRWLGTLFSTSVQWVFLVDFSRSFFSYVSSLFVICKTLPRYVIAEIFLVVFFFFCNFQLTESSLDTSANLLSVYTREIQIVFCTVINICCHFLEFIYRLPASREWWRYKVVV